SAGKIEAGELLETNIALPPRNYATRVAFDALLPDDMRGFQSHLTVNSIAALRFYARLGAGVAVVPEIAIWDRASIEGLAIIELVGSERVGTRVCVCRHRARSLSAAARRLLDDLLED